MSVTHQVMTFLVLTNSRLPSTVSLYNFDTFVKVQTVFQVLLTTRGDDNVQR